jgi:hypothetical protein
LHPAQIAAYQFMTAEQKLNDAMKLYQTAKTLTEASLKQQHPDWNDEEIKKRVKEIFLYART